MSHIKELSEIIRSSLIAALIFAILFGYTKWKLNRRHFCALAAKIPGIEGVPMLPIIGHSASLIGSVEELIAKTRKICAKTRPPRKVWILHELLVMINRAEDMEVILNSRKCLSKHDIYFLNEKLTGRGLFILPVPEWKKHRKILMPTFNQKILEGFVDCFAEQAEVFVQMLRSKTDEIIDISNYTAKYSLDIVCETAMGIQIKAQINNIELEKIIIRTMDIITKRLTILPYHNDWIYQFTNLSKEENKLTDTYNKFISDVVEKKLSEYRNEVDARNNYTYLEKTKRSTFLELLIELTENGENWTNDELLSEVSTFMIAGSDTTATVTAFVMVLLGMHKEIQEKCFEEIKEVIGLERKIMHTDLSKFVYLEQVIKETMRMFPPGCLLFRKVDEDLEVGGYVLPKGAGIALYVLAMHYSEDYYKNPLIFDPDRFTPEEIAKRHKYAYLPFSAGPRNCIGPRFGMMAVKTLLANTIRNYRMETTYKDVGDIRIKQTIVIKAVEGYPLRLTSRN